MDFVFVEVEAQLAGVKRILKLMEHCGESHPEYEFAWEELKTRLGYIMDVLPEPSSKKSKQL